MTNEQEARILSAIASLGGGASADEPADTKSGKKSGKALVEDEEEKP